MALARKSLEAHQYRRRYREAVIARTTAIHSIESTQLLATLFILARLSQSLRSSLDCEASQGLERPREPHPSFVFVHGSNTWGRATWYNSHKSELYRRFALQVRLGNSQWFEFAKSRMLLLNDYANGLLEISQG